MASDYYADLILADLIKEGFTGEQLLDKFREKQSKLHTTIKHLIAESGEAARNYKKGGNDETKELFGDIMGD